MSANCQVGWWVIAIGSLISLGACQGMPVIPPMPKTVAPLSTWVDPNQAILVCPGSKLVVMDPSMQTTWCQGPIGSEGQFTVNCNVNGRAHTSTGRCTQSGNAMTCAYSADNRPYSFNGKRSSGGVCKG
jgi:hypothetical protein